MANQAVTLKDPVTGDLLYPATVLSQIYNGDGTSFDPQGLIDAAINKLQVTFTYRVFVINIVTGNPISGATVIATHDGETIATVISDENGIADIKSEYFSIEYAASHTSEFDTVEGSVTANKLGINPAIAGLSNLTKPTFTEVGEVITWDNKEWLVCHYDETTKLAYFIANKCLGQSVFGNNGVYKGSKLAATAKTYETQQMSEAALRLIEDTTVENVTAKVFVPTYSQMNGGFSWFNSNDRRIAVMQETGNTGWYYTSSRYSSGAYAYYIVDNGTFSHQYGAEYARGFRPCIAIKMD